MDLNHVAVFARVVELESFTAAAKHLGLPKSSVSRTVTRLEDELGVRLLQRTTRKLRLTEAGQAYYERARVALAGLEEAASAATNLSAEPRGTVRMSAPSDMGSLHFGDMVARFVRKYPLVHVEISLTSRKVSTWHCALGNWQTRAWSCARLALILWACSHQRPTFGDADDRKRWR